MSRSKLLTALVLGLAASACGRAPAPPFSTDAGTQALSRDDSILYVVDTDKERLRVVESATRRTLAQVPVGKAPEQVAVGADDTIYVTNRGSRSVSVIRKGQWKESARITVGIEPLALALSRDGGTLFVLNGSSHEHSDVGTLTAVDTRTLQTRWDLPMGLQPTGVQVVDNGDVLVTLHRSGELVRVDLTNPASPRVVGHASPVADGRISTR